MSARPFVIGASLLAHGGLIFALGEISVSEAFTSTTISVVDSPREEEKPTPPPPPPPQAPTLAPEAPRQASQNPRPQAAAPEEAPPPSASNPLADLPDFGLELGGSGGPGGFAVAQGTGPLTPRPKTVTKSLAQAPTPALTPSADTCNEGPAKPQLIHLPQPVYTETARAAGIEGRVRLQLTVDEQGKVVSAQVLSSLGHGLDEAALSAARSASFKAAQRCGKVSRSTFTISIRFSASS